MLITTLGQTDNNTFNVEDVIPLMVGLLSRDHVTKAKQLLDRLVTSEDKLAPFLKHMGDHTLKYDDQEKRELVMVRLAKLLHEKGLSVSATEIVQTISLKTTSLAVRKEVVRFYCHSDFEAAKNFAGEEDELLIELIAELSRIDFESAYNLLYDKLGEKSESQARAFIRLCEVNKKLIEKDEFFIDQIYCMIHRAASIIQDNNLLNLLPTLAATLYPIVSSEKIKINIHNEIESGLLIMKLAKLLHERGLPDHAEKLVQCTISYYCPIELSYMRGPIEVRKEIMSFFYAKNAKEAIEYVECHRHDVTVRNILMQELISLIAEEDMDAAVKFMETKYASGTIALFEAIIFLLYKKIEEIKTDASLKEKAEQLLHVAFAALRQNWDTDSLYPTLLALWAEINPMHSLTLVSEIHDPEAKAKACKLLAERLPPKWKGAIRPLLLELAEVNAEKASSTPAYENFISVIKRTLMGSAAQASGGPSLQQLVPYKPFVNREAPNTETFPEIVHQLKFALKIENQSEKIKSLITLIPKFKKLDFANT